jgi:predicted aspartyl protease
LELGLSNPQRPGATEYVELEVRPEALFSWISQARLQRIGVDAFRMMSFRKLDGTLIQRGMAAVQIGLAGYTALEGVVSAQESEQEFIGCHTLAAVGLKFDEADNKLVEPIWPALVAD